MSSIENSYNRPNFPFRCGRGATWDKPCAGGPNADGSCGGITACAPRQTGDRYVCRRSALNGGACEDGPLPDGTCCLSQLPCQPRRTLRSIRFRLSLFALVILAALIGAFGSSGDLFSQKAPLLIDPGQLSNHHAGLAGKGNCESCHEPHSADSTTFLLAAFKPSGPTSDGTGNKCLTCHDFPQMKTSVHKSENCSTCHTEHKGAIAKTSTLTDKQCHTCHDVKFETFSKSHPSFGKTYPYSKRTALNFDHTAHLGTHFKDARYSEKAPEGRCLGCHEVSEATNNVPIKSYEESCSACHDDQISSKKLVLLQMPELVSQVDPLNTLAEYCDLETMTETEYESVSLDPLNPILSVLMDVDPDDVAAYESRVSSLLSGLAKEELSSLTALIDEADGNAQELLSGLSPSLLKAVSCSWAANKEFETGSSPIFGGWSADELSVNYTASKHNDAVLKAWLNFAADIENESLNEAVLNSDGPGSCIKCHSVSETDAVRVEWKPRSRKLSDYSKYNHQPHLDLLGPGSQCETCHELNKTADYAAAFKHTDPNDYASNFNAISKDVCSSCHKENKVSETCLTCHEYHVEPLFKADVMAGSIDTKKMMRK
jgi:predicted CXXCH cytochrome family protein